MCGIHGLITTDTYASNTDDFIKDCFYANTVRGIHSSGIFQVATNYDVRTFKKAVNGLDFCKETEATSIITQSPRSRVTVGHVRHATQGASDKDNNAHPFVVTRDDGSKVYVVHNGSLRNWRNKKDSTGIDVDSAWAAKMLATENADAFEYFDGPFCFVWYDTREKDVLNVARNNERPFHFMGSKDGKSILFASELGMLGWLAERNKIAAKPLAGYKTDFLFLDPGKIYRFNIKNIGEWECVEYPKYDPSTTIYQPTSSYHPAQRGTGHPYSRRADYEDGWDYYGDGMPWNAHGGYDWQRYDREEMDRTLNGFKSILKKHRDQRTPTVNDVNYDELDRAIREAREEHEREKAAKQKEEARADDRFLGSVLLEPNDASATKKEIQQAKDAEIYGLVVPYVGVMYDDDLGECLGNARVVIKGHEYPIIDACVRMISSRVAHKRYIHSEDIGPRAMVVIGYDPSGPFPSLILEEMGEERRKFMSGPAPRQLSLH